MTSSLIKYALLDAECIRITNQLIIYLRFHNLESVSVRDFEPRSAVASFSHGNKCQFQSVSNKSGFTDCIELRTCALVMTVCHNVIFTSNNLLLSLLYLTPWKILPFDI